MDPFFLISDWYTFPRMLSGWFETESVPGWIMVRVVALEGDILFMGFLSKVKKMLSGAVEKISRG